MELGIDITTDNFLCTTDYSLFRLTMHVYLCSVESGKIELREHKSAHWFTVEILDSMGWFPADIYLFRY